MNERITLVGIFDKNNLEKITRITNNINEKLCKVPFEKNVTDRYEVDTLPYHFTLSAWNVSEEEIVLNKLSNLRLHKTKITIDSIAIMDSAEDSYILHFHIKDNDNIKLLQETIYNSLPTEKYNPEKIKFHITIHVDKNYSKILEIKKCIEEFFVPFELEVNTIRLYEIYPAMLIQEYNLI